MACIDDLEERVICGVRGGGAPRTGPTSKHYAPQDYCFGVELQDVANGRCLVQRAPGGGVLVDPGLIRTASVSK